MPNVRLWKQATGAARSFDNPERVVSFGLPGAGDLSGIILGGVRLEIECKTGEAVQNKDQKNFEAMILKFGGIYLVVRTKEEAIQKVQQAAMAMQARGK